MDVDGYFPTFDLRGKRDYLALTITANWGAFMVRDDVFDKICEAEIGAADLRIECLVRSVKGLEKAGHHREANRSRELLTLLTKAQGFRRLRQQRVQAARIIKL